MIEKLLPFVEKYNVLSEKLCDANIIADMEQYRKIAKEHSALQEYADLYKKYTDAQEKRKTAESIIAENADAELTELAKAEVAEAASEIEKLEEEARILLLPRDKNASKRLILVS